MTPGFIQISGYLGYVCLGKSLIWSDPTFSEHCLVGHSWSCHVSISNVSQTVFGVAIHKLHGLVKGLRTFPEQGKRFFKMEVNEANLGQLAVYLQQTLSPQAEVNCFRHFNLILKTSNLHPRCENLLRTSSHLWRQTRTTLSSFFPFSTVRLGNLISRWKDLKKMWRL